MLVDVKQFTPDQLAILTAGVFDDRPINGRANWPKKIGQGMYQIGHFNLDLWIKHLTVGIGSSYDLKWDEKISRPNGPDHELYSYGVVDEPGQLLELAPFLVSDPRKFVISFTLIDAEEQPACGGWRWHKWGPYIGIQKSVCEYIYDEPEIKQVYVYHIYEVNE